MAQSYVSENGTIYLAGAYPSYKVQKTVGGLSATGVLMLVGEADQGPAYSEEDKISDNFFSVDEKAQVVSKYGSGALVDAYLNATSAANDPDILGAPSAIYLLKTNTSVAASLNLLKTSGGIWAALTAKSAGKLGNFIYASVVADTVEAVPSVTFSYMPPGNALGTSLKVCGNADGTAADCGVHAQYELPASLVSTINGTVAAAAIVTASGGTARLCVGASVAILTVTVVTGASLPTIVITTAEPTGWAVAPVVGDTLYIMTASTIKGVGNKNMGGYLVTSVTTSSVTAIKVRNLAGTVAVSTDVEATTGVANGGSFDAHAPVTIAMDAAFMAPAIDGYGKSLEISNSATGGAFSDSCYNLTNGVPVQCAWNSKVGAGVVVPSIAETIRTLNVNRQSDGASEEWTVGGDIVINVGIYHGTASAATMTISDTALTTTITGATAYNLSLNLRDFKTVGDLVAYINSQTYYTATVGSGFYNQMLLNVDSKCILDHGTFNIWAVNDGAMPGRIKMDAYAFEKELADSSALVELASRPAAGLPIVTAVSYLSAGARGGSTNTSVGGAIDACERIRGNFLVTLFSRNYIDDAAEGLTDATSTYTIDAINAYAKSHVLKMSTVKRRRNRQAFVSKNGTFTEAKAAANILASHRVAMTFQDSRNVNSAGELIQFQSWLLAVQAAAMQAAGFYRSILFKKINTSGVLMADNTFDDAFDPDLEDAVRNGLLVAQAADDSGFKWNSDQTTYGTDDNFVWNSIQAVYAADTVALTLAQRMERNYVGQSLADVSASAAMTFLKGIMSDLKRLKLIASSDDAVLGFKNAKIKIAGNVMTIDLEIKLATTLVFIPITFMVTQVTQEATQ